MIRILTFAVLMSIINLAQAQNVYKFAVQFTDKDQTPFSINQPEEFLSQRSVDRRTKFHIAYTETDLPIDPVYIEDVLGATSDANLLIKVKWMNTIIISLSDSNNIDIIENLPHVEKTEMVYNYHLKSNKQDKLNYSISSEEPLARFKGVQSYDSSYYGGGWVQIHQLMGEKLHEQGHKGQGMVIAVLDAGFVSADTLRIFEPLWENGQVLGTYNFVDPGHHVFAGSSHGTFVFSTMGGSWEGTLIGTAPEASYWLLRTEDTDSENIIEEYNWVAGAAFADSVGADVLNTSLGYIDFDDARYDHTWEDLDGNKTIITRGANMAYKCGMLVVNSAGNSGNGSWRYLGAPADGVDVFSLGAVDGDGVIAGFSSHGFPWSDDVKPNVVARGAGAYGASAYSNTVGQSNGTSFSSPILAGMAASLWSANPSLPPYWIKQAIQQSADRYMLPDTLYGYGMPNFQVALSILGVNGPGVKDNYIQVLPNPVQSIAYLSLNNKDRTDLELRIYDMQGRVILINELTYTGQQIPVDVSRLTSGVYILETKLAKETYRIKINKL